MRPFPGDDDPLLDALERFAVEAVGLTARAVTEVADVADLTLSQWRALVVVDAAPGSRVATVASRLGKSKTSASRLIRRLERAGAVAVVTDPADAAASVVYPTEGGSAFRAIVAQRRLALLREALGDGPRHAGPGIVTALNAITEALAGSDASASR